MPEPLTIAGLGGGVVGLTVHLARRHFDLSKEILDIVAGSILLVLAAPLILLCAAMIRLTSRGPAFFTQVRVGKNGRHFRMYKLRSMRVDAERKTGAVWASNGDSRVLPVARWMRRSHVDELPQLLNVIKGDMSLVGPRPERPEILAELQRTYPQVHMRHAVRPGITGLAQVRNGYDTNVEAFAHKLRADMEYIESRGWGLDLWILLHTLPKFRDSSAR